MLLKFTIVAELVPGAKEVGLLAPCWHLLSKDRWPDWSLLYRIKDSLPSPQLGLASF